jgi:predicted ATP-grasp superfamily ATP-dependent carboligase
LIVTKDGVNLKKGIFITGFHGIGQTGQIATSYLIHALKAERIGFLRANEIPPFVTTSEDGLITPFEIYQADKLIMLRLEFPPSRKEESNILRSIASWIVNEGLEEVVLIGGLDESFKETKDDELKIVPNSAYIKKHKNLSDLILESGLYVFGPLATFLIEFEFYHFPAVALLPYASTEQADPSAAALVLQYIAKMYNFPIDVKELEEDAKEIEIAIERKMKQAKESGGIYV